MEFSFNLRVFVKSYGDLGCATDLNDWNVRVYEGEIRLDNLRNETTTIASFATGLLFIEVRSWNNQADAKRQIINLTNPNSGWRDFATQSICALEVVSLEAQAFIAHLVELESSLGPE